MNRINKHALALLNNDKGQPLAIVMHQHSTAPHVPDWKDLTHYCPSEPGTDLRLLNDGGTAHLLVDVDPGLIEAHGLGLELYVVDDGMDVVAALKAAPIGGRA